MPNLSLMLCFPLLTVSCATVQPGAKQAPPSPPGFVAEVARCEQALATARSLLEGDAIEESSVLDRATLTELRIQSVTWPTTISATEADALNATQSRGMLACTLDRWPGYDELERFSEAVDPVFFLDAPGHQVIEARMAKGGVGSPANDWGATLLMLSHDLEPGVRYSMRPRNGNPGYRWSVASDVVVVLE